MKTGIPKLSSMIKHDIQDGKILLITSPLGIDVSVFAKQIAYTNLKEGKKVSYLILNKTPSNLIESIKKFDWDQKAIENLKIIDGFSSTIGLPPETAHFINATKVEESIEKIKQIVSIESSDMLVVEDISDLICKNEKWIEGLNALKVLPISRILVFTDLGLQPDATKTVIDSSEYVLKISVVEERLLLKNYYHIVKAPEEFDRKKVPFRVSGSGISIYVPKILITGPFHAGKSTFIRKLSNNSVSVDRMGTTIALDHGYIEGNGLVVDLFGTPGQERFDFMLDILNADTFGVILIVDSTNPGEFERAKTMLEKVGGYGIPFVVAANKQDMEGALDPEKVKEELGYEEADVIPTVAIKGIGVTETLQKLIDKIVGGE